MSLDIKKINDSDTEIALAGRLDTNTAPQLENTLESLLNNGKSLTLDLENLEYVSSAGLRVILKAQKAKNGNGGLKLVHVNESVKEIFDITGFSDFLIIE